MGPTRNRADRRCSKPSPRTHATAGSCGRPDPSSIASGYDGATERLKYDIFISYASEDADKVGELTEHLIAFGARVWHDKAIIRPGDSIRRSIQHGIESARFLGLALSAKSVDKLRMEKGYLTFEEYLGSIEQDLDNRVRVIPLLIDPDLDPTRLPLKYRDRRYLNLTGSDYPSAFRELANFLGLSTPPRLIHTRDGTGLVHIPGGRYVWGQAGVEAEYVVNDFYIGETMVSLAQYQRFLEEATPESDGWLAGAPWAGTRVDLMPACGMEFAGAEAYCSWADIRLPTAFELEYLVLQRHAHGVEIEELTPSSRLAEWTSTSGVEFGKGSPEESEPSRIALWTCFEMNRNLQTPVVGGSLDIGFRCASDVDLAFTTKWRIR